MSGNQGRTGATARDGSSTVTVAQIVSDSLRVRDDTESEQRSKSRSKDNSSGRFVEPLTSAPVGRGRRSSITALRQRPDSAVYRSNEQLEREAIERMNAIRRRGEAQLSQDELSLIERRDQELAAINERVNLLIDDFEAYDDQTADIALVRELLNGFGTTCSERQRLLGQLWGWLSQDPGVPQLENSEITPGDMDDGTSIESTAMGAALDEGGTRQENIQHQLEDSRDRVKRTLSLALASYEQAIRDECVDPEAMKRARDLARMSQEALLAAHDENDRLLSQLTEAKEEIQRQTAQITDDARRVESLKTALNEARLSSMQANEMLQMSIKDPESAAALAVQRVTTLERQIAKLQMQLIGQSTGVPIGDGEPDANAARQAKRARDAERRAIRHGVELEQRVEELEKALDLSQRTMMGALSDSDVCERLRAMFEEKANEAQRRHKESSAAVDQVARAAFGGTFFALSDDLIEHGDPATIARVAQLAGQERADIRSELDAVTEETRQQYAALAEALGMVQKGDISAFVQLARLNTALAGTRQAQEAALKDKERALVTAAFAASQKPSAIGATEPSATGQRDASGKAERGAAESPLDKTGKGRKQRKGTGLSQDDEQSEELSTRCTDLQDQLAAARAREEALRREVERLGGAPDEVVAGLPAARASKPTGETPVRSKKTTQKRRGGSSPTRSPQSSTSAGAAGASSQRSPQRATGAKSAHAVGVRRPAPANISPAQRTPSSTLHGDEDRPGSVLRTPEVTGGAAALYASRTSGSEGSPQRGSGISPVHERRSSIQEGFSEQLEGPNGPLASPSTADGEECAQPQKPAWISEVAASVREATQAAGAAADVDEAAPVQEATGRWSRAVQVEIIVAPASWTSPTSTVGQKDLVEVANGVYVPSGDAAPVDALITAVNEGVVRPNGPALAAPNLLVCPDGSTVCLSARITGKDGKQLDAADLQEALREGDVTLAQVSVLAERNALLHEARLRSLKEYLDQNPQLSPEEREQILMAARHHHRKAAEWRQQQQSITQQRVRNTTLLPAESEDQLSNVIGYLIENIEEAAPVDSHGFAASSAVTE